MDRDLGLELARVTETAAIASVKWMGRGDKNAADQAAVTGMRNMFDTVNIDGVVVIGEGEKDEAPMLYIGEEIGIGASSFSPSPMTKRMKRSVSAVPMRQRLISR